MARGAKNGGKNTIQGPAAPEAEAFSCQGGAARACRILLARSSRDCSFANLKINLSKITTEFLRACRCKPASECPLPPRASLAPPPRLSLSPRRGEGLRLPPPPWARAGEAADLRPAIPASSLRPCSSSIEMGRVFASARPFEF